MTIKPPFPYFGSKFNLRRKILAHIESVPHSVFGEPFLGSGVILLNKKRVACEVVNDKEKDITNFFRVLRDADSAAELIRQVRLTPFSRDEYTRACETEDWREKLDPIERARTWLVLRCQGFVGGRIYNSGYWGGHRYSSQRTSEVRSWYAKPDIIEAVADRIRGVIIHSCDGVDLVRAYDSPSTLMYLDPPYLHEARRETTGYTIEMDDADHENLCRVLCSMEGAFVLSGYDNTVYRDCLDSKGVNKIRIGRLEAPTRRGIKTADEYIWTNTDRLQDGLFDMVR